jgi:hypothetical protein
MVADDEPWWPIKDSATGEYVLAQKLSAAGYGHNKLRTFVNALNKALEAQGSPDDVPYTRLRLTLRRGNPLEKRRFKTLADRLKCGLTDIASAAAPIDEAATPLESSPIDDPEQANILNSDEELGLLQVTLEDSHLAVAIALLSRAAKMGIKSVTLKAIRLEP